MSRSIRLALVTGGAGFIGTALCEILMERGLSVRSLDLREPRRPVAGVDYRLGDVRSSGQVCQAVSGAETVFHLAAIVSVPLCQADPTESYLTNFQGTLVVLDAIRNEIRKQGRPIGLAFASSAALYGGRGRAGVPLREEDLPGSVLSFYAAQKLASEHAIALYHGSFGIPSLAFRFFNVYGQGQDPGSPYSGVITVFCDRARRGEPLFLHGGGDQTRDFVWVKDVAAGLASALELPWERWQGAVVNLGSGRPVSIRRLAELIVENSESALENGKIRSEIRIAPPRDGDVPHSLADVTRARELLGYSARGRIETGIAELIGDLARPLQMR